MAHHSSDTTEAAHSTGIITSDEMAGHSNASTIGVSDIHGGDVSSLHGGGNGSNDTHGDGAHGGHGVHKCGQRLCISGVILPSWNPPVDTISTGQVVLRFFVYVAVQIYLFIGMSLIADRFVAAIEVIVSKKRKVKVVSKQTGEIDYVQVPVWNETVAHLTLFVLGGCAPEILLTLVETVMTWHFELGPSVIIGSGCYNLFIITGICIGSVSGRAKRVLELPIFFTTGAWSIFAYMWLYFITVMNTNSQIEVWEAVTTLAFFPGLVITAYIVDKNFFGFFNCCCKNKTHAHHSEAETAKEVLERREKRFLTLMAELRAKNPSKTTKELQEEAELELLKELPKGRNYYRMENARRMAGGGELINKEKLREKFTHTNAKHNIEPDQQVISFDPPTYTVMEDCGKCQLNVFREGDHLNNTVTVDYATKDGTGKDGADYRRTSGQLTFQNNESLKHIFVDIVDDDTYKADTTFYVTLSNPKLTGAAKGKVELGTDSMATVTKLDDDHGGQFHFASAETEFEESCGEAVVKVLRSSGARGCVSVPVRIKPIDAMLGVHFHDPKLSRITFEDRQAEYPLTFNIIDEGKLDPKTVRFAIELGDPSWSLQKMDSGLTTSKLGKPILRDPNILTVTITENKGLKRIINDIAEADVGELVGTSTWKEQFITAFTVASAEPENEGDLPRKTFYEYFVHLSTFLWKFLFAFIPPTAYLGGWASFLVSFIWIGIITAVIRDIAGALGCTIGLPDELTAVTFVSLGTSLPDLFASRIAAIREESADAAIGHVSGANAVNVFLGIGLSWSIAAIKLSFDGKKLIVDVSTFPYCIVLFFSFCSCAIFVLLLRRLPPVHGELGGPRIFKILTVMFFWGLWVGYVLLVALESYCIFKPSL